MANNLPTTTVNQTGLTVPDAAAAREIAPHQWSAFKQAVWPGANDETVCLALDYCKARGLDPMQKPVHIVKTWNNETRRYEESIWEGINSHRTRASRTKEYDGISEPEFGEPQTEKFGFGDGSYELTFPEWCKIKVYRRGRTHPFVGLVYWRETYASVKGGAPNAMWRKRPYSQLAKCAEAEALRKAFPEEVGGMPTAEEMDGQAVVGFDNARDITPSQPKQGDPALAGLVQTTAKKPVDIDIPSDLDRRNSPATNEKTHDDAQAGTDDLQDELGDGGDHVNSSAVRASSTDMGTTSPTGEQNTVSKQADTPPGAAAGSGQSAGAGNSPQAAGSPPVSNSASVPLIDDPDAKMIRLINPGNKSIEQEWTRTNTNVDHWCSALQEILWENQGAPAVFAAWWNLHKDAAHAFQRVLSKKPEHKSAYSNMGGLIEFAEGTMGDHDKQCELV